jgi:uncharacterized protein (DUF2147 family)
MVTKRTLIAAAAVLFGMTAAWADPLAATDPIGEWMVAKGYARIKVVDCGGKLWGVVAWEQTPGIDNKNPDQTVRGRPTLGMPILIGMARSKPNQWDGQIYNSEDGHTYSANISLANPDTLKVQGCFLGFLCGGENWSRVPPEAIPAPPPSATSNQRPTPPKPSNARTANAKAPDPVNDVCLRLFGPTGLPHESGLK